MTVAALAVLPENMLDMKDKISAEATDGMLKVTTATISLAYKRPFRNDFVPLLSHFFRFGQLGFEESCKISLFSWLYRAVILYMALLSQKREICQLRPLITL